MWIETRILFSLGPLVVERALCARWVSFYRETGLIPRSASRCQMIARVERALRRAFNKRAQERPLHLERFATETS
jgi:hypothetical protein